MAVIGKIRNRMGVLLVVFVGVALLAFVLGDLLSSSQYFFSGNRTTVGEMNGNSIKVDKFDKRYNEREKAFGEANPGTSIDDEARSSFLDQTWQEFIDEYVFDPAFAKAGLSVSYEELQDMEGGRFIHPYLQQFPEFTNPQTGQYDPALLQNFLNSMAMDETEVPEENREQWLQSRNQWASIEELIEKNRLQVKYQTLLEKGMYVTDKEVARQYAESGDRFNIRYVGKSYSEVADSTIEITDADLKKAYDENKNRFRSDYAVRGLRYALFDIVPAAKDSAALLSKIAGLKSGFQTSTDDTAFVYSNSDLQNDPRFLKKELLSKNLDSALFNAPNGFVYGPYFDGGSYYLAKKLAEKTSADSLNVTAILLAKNTKQGPRAGIKEKADSILKAVKAGADIKALAFSISEDPTTSKDSGSVGWVPYEVSGINPIMDTAYNSPIGTVKLVEIPDGYAIVRTEGKTAPTRKVLIAFVSSEIKASEETVNKAYSAASDFALTNKTIEDFDKAAKSGKYVIRDDAFLRENAKSVTGIPESKSLVKWAFDKKVGDVSAIEQFSNRYLVAIVTKTWSAGIPKFDEVKKDLEPIAKMNKKAEKFIEEMKAAGTSGNIDQVGTSIKKPVIPATDITFQSYGVPGAGYEPSIVGAATGAPQGKLVGPYKGINGVYMVVVDAINKGATPPAGPQQKADMSRMVGQRAFSESFEALKAAAEVSDLRHKFY